MLDGIRHSVQNRMTMVALRRKARSFNVPEMDVLHVWDKIHRLLVFWPGGGIDLIAARVVLNRIKDRFPQASLTLLTLPGIGGTTPTEIEADLIELNSKDLNFVGLPSKSFLSDFRERSFDAVIDLSPSFSPLAGYLSLITEAPLRIGFAGPERDLAFNFQVAPRSERSGIDRYRVLARYIG